MLISHETPISMLNVSRYYNDYDYCLVHLLPTHEKYKDFYFESVRKGRHVLLDNSIFELGVAYDSREYAQWILDLKPTEYIIPDVLENTHETISSFQAFKKEYGDLPGKVIGVVQGKNYQELVECYKFMASHVDKIAISFDYSYYLEEGEESTIELKTIVEHLNLPDTAFESKWCKYAVGRFKLIKSLIRDNVWEDKPHHLLGCSVPWEFKLLNKSLQNNKVRTIQTIDTSNPIVAGLTGKCYDASYGLVDKWSCKLVDFITSDVTVDQVTLIQDNIWKFKHLINS